MASLKQSTAVKEAKGVAIAILIALTIRWLLLESYVIPSGSMLPSLLINDHIFINKIIYGIRVPFSKTFLVEFQKPARGDVIVFRYPEEEGTFYIKRIVGIPGDRLRMDEKDLYVNDVAVQTTAPESSWDFDWVRSKDLGPWDDRENYNHFTEVLGDKHHSILRRKDGPFKTLDEITIPEGKYFAVGDNRENSKDSRYWGYVPHENILGRASFVWLSCDEMISFLPFLCNPLEVRARRFFHPIR